METIDFDRLTLTPGMRVLDVGCGEGRHVHAAALENVAEVVGLDLERSNLTAAREDYETYIAGETDVPVTFLSGDALRLPFADGAFDVVCCTEVLEHLPDYESAIDELRRVCAPGGTLAVSVPRAGPERVCWALSDDYHEVEGGHVRIFDREELRAAIERRGFRRVDGHFAHALHAPYWWLKCLWWDRDQRGDAPLPLRAYDRFLEWDVLESPRPVRLLEQALDPVVGKSVVYYFELEGRA
ncbi:class I SAM-dependent methyltransferase [Natrinema salaciae]|uniref:Ubiquinone/menaquinone biosynthesis C-methylase UbiE n=1 Tax=Natrinema salaciae TaxID=1186196 RepID=A0A1H9K7E4_9EURY|nr:class I SAM-dependent methyltransferase [Natrinema salaciae]SEQ94843.1 Ubiquinone/menaquinone biosynthesis C-methylase UbiE [Natrinema salaciae]